MLSHFSLLSEHREALADPVLDAAETGDDCFVLKVVDRSMRHLEEVTGRIAGLGSVTTSVVYSSPLTGRAIAVD